MMSCILFDFREEVWYNKDNKHRGGNKMKRQIRRGVFETNSSSMHSLTVIKKNEKYTPEEIQEDFYLYDDRSSGEKNCIWYIYGDDLDFGRQPFR